MANNIVSIFPQENKYIITFDHSGPSSYAQSTGDVVNATDLGFGGIEYINVAGDSSKTYYVWPIFNLAIPPSVGYPSPTGGNAVPSVQIHWYAFSGNAEVGNGTNLSTFAVRLQAQVI